MSNDKKEYKGKVITPFIVGSKKPKRYKVGSTFTTTHENSLEHLVKTGRVELITKKNKQ